MYSRKEYPRGFYFKKPRLPRRIKKMLKRGVIKKKPEPILPNHPVIFFDNQGTEINQILKDQNPHPFSGPSVLWVPLGGLLDGFQFPNRELKVSSSGHAFHVVTLEEPNPDKD